MVRCIGHFVRLMISLLPRPPPDPTGFEGQRQKPGQGNRPYSPPVEHHTHELGGLLLNLGVSHLHLEEMVLLNLDFNYTQVFYPQINK